MHPIEMTEVTAEFVRCWQAASTHLEDQAAGQINGWMPGYALIKCQRFWNTDSFALETGETNCFLSG